MANARKISLNAIVKVFEGGFSNIVLDSLLECDLSSEDKALATNIFYGVLENKITLEYRLGTFLKKPIDKLPLLVRGALLIGAYQIIHLDKIPPHAAVNESVNLVAKSKFSSFKGLTNGVLRSLLREGAKPIPQDNLSLLYSVNESIVSAVVGDYGEEVARQIFSSALCTPEIYIRKNTKVDFNITAIKTDLDNCYIIKGSPRHQAGYAEGAFYVQDKSSQLCCAFLGAKQGERILDVCAAPGGKSFTLSQTAGQVVSCDIHPHRVELIKKGAKRLRLDNIKAIQNDATLFNQNLGQFDRVLCDVPCSGSGVIGRKPDIKYKKLEDISLLNNIQLKILSTSSKYVKQGGILQYSTCSILKKENEQIVAKFLKDGNFELLESKTLLPIGNVTDGFFMAKMIRRK